MPLYEFSCALHGKFEELLKGQWLSWKCPKCGEEAPRIASRFAFRGFSEHAIEFGGRTFRRDDVEEALGARTETPAFYETPEYRDKFMEKLSKNAYKEMHGTLEPETATLPDKVAEQTIASMDVNPEVVKATSDNLVETMRRTEFKE
jgi:putative FmdB family regulatory protein